MTPDELQRHLDLARPALAPSWDDDRAARVEEGLPARERARRRTRLLVTAAGLFLGLSATAFVLRARTPEVLLEPVAGAQVIEEPSTEGRRFSLSQGTVRFAVKRGQRAPVRVAAGPVEVLVTGTRFLVERAGDRVRVAVEEGTVEVRWDGGSRALSGGTEGWFPPEHERAARAATVKPAAPPQPAEATPVHEALAIAEPAAAPSTAPTEVEPIASPTPPVKKSVRPPSGEGELKELMIPEWKHLATLGDFTKAWEAMKTAPAPRDETAELLLAADVARLSGHAEAAVAPLEQVVQHHATDARASLAAFTLGRVLLDDLGRPREAAAAFESARALAPASRLAEDALARQVEAASRAQDPQTRALAETFVTLYPSSPRLRAVRHFGGLEK